MIQLIMPLIMIMIVTDIIVMIRFTMLLILIKMSAVLIYTIGNMTRMAYHGFEAFSNDNLYDGTYCNLKWYCSYCIIIPPTTM